MARIVPSDLAPAEEVNYSLGQSEFSLAAGGSHETDDPFLISDAEAHPWLSVERDEEEVVRGEYADISVDPHEDVLSRYTSVAFDRDEVRRVIEESRRHTEADRTAIDAGLDQGKSVEGPQGIDFTLAADNNSEDNE